jgi:dienelactone hydrolase
LRISPAIGLLLALCAVAPTPAVSQDAPSESPSLANDIHETIARVPVSVTLANGKQYSGRIVVTHYRPDGQGPFPLAVINHGRTTEPDKRAEPARWRYTGMARYFIRRGFAVLVLTRLGYGDAGVDPDPESSGRSCDNRDFSAGLAAFIQETSAALDFARSLPWADTRRTVLVGHSYGGLGAVAMTGKKPSGVIAAINFGGGSGGSPQRRPGRPCSPEKITAIMKDAGGSARIPTDWLYAENDHYWGTEWPRRWHAAYTGAGGRAEMAMLPPTGDEGHFLMTRGFSTWRPVVDRFLAGIGFPPPHAIDAPPSTGFARLDEASRIPYVKEEVKTDGYKKFLDSDIPRAFAISPSGAWGWRNGNPDAPQQAIENCQKFSKAPCRLYAVDDAVVWKP